MVKLDIVSIRGEPNVTARICNSLQQLKSGHLSVMSNIISVLFNIMAMIGNCKTSLINC